MPVGFPPSARTLANAINNFGRKVVDVATDLGRWFNRVVRRRQPAPSAIQAARLSRTEKTVLLDQIKSLDPEDTWLQSRTVSKLNDVLTHNQYVLLNKAINNRDPAAARTLYYQIRRDMPGVASLLVDVMTEGGARKKEWAKPFPQPGLINSFKLDERLHRCAQPDKAALQRLKQQGFHVINLRHFHSDLTVAGDKEYGGSRFRVPTKAPLPFVAPVLKEIIKHPKVYIHCLHGSDRTGFMCAAYRMVVQRWTADEAIAEYTKGDFGYHAKVFPELPGLLKKLEENIESIREEVGCKPPGGVKLPAFRHPAIMPARKSKIPEGPPAIMQAKKNPNIPGEESSG